jgi:hypothetical protein
MGKPLPVKVAENARGGEQYRLNLFRAERRERLIAAGETGIYGNSDYLREIFADPNPKKAAERVHMTTEGVYLRASVALRQACSPRN